MENKYLTYFSVLNVNKQIGIPAPHKAILLLSIIDLIENNFIKMNRFILTEALEGQFKLNWERYVGHSILFKPKIATPFWHMSGEPFWRLVGVDNTELKKDKFKGSVYSIENLRNQVKYVEIDDELFELFLSEDVRTKFRVLLISTYLVNQHLQNSGIIPIIITYSFTMLSIAS